MNSGPCMYCSILLHRQALLLYLDAVLFAPTWPHKELTQVLQRTAVSKLALYLLYYIFIVSVHTYMHTFSVLYTTMLL